MNPAQAPRINLTRQRVYDKANAKAKGQRVNAMFGRQFSTVFIKGTVVNPVPGEPGSPTQAYLKFNKDEQIWFSYGYGDQSLDDGLGNKFRPTRAETSIEYAYRLDPQTMFAVERIFIQPGKPRIKYTDAVAGASDTVVAAAYNGDLDPNTNLPVEVHDPSGIMTPKELTVGTQTEHHVAYEAMRHVATVEFTLGSGGRSSRKLGPLALFDSGGTESKHTSFGGNESGFGYQLPEGILWDSENEVEGRIGFLLKIERPIVIPITLPVQFIGQEEPVRMTPQQVSLPIKLTCEGFEVRVGDEFNR